MFESVTSTHAQSGLNYLSYDTSLKKLNFPNNKNKDRLEVFAGLNVVTSKRHWRRYSYPHSVTKWWNILPYKEF
jgi:hypothetical protein